MALLQRLPHGVPCASFSESEEDCLLHRTAADSACHWCCGHSCALDKPGTRCESWAGLLDSSSYYGRSRNGLGHDSCTISSTPSSTSASLLQTSAGGSGSPLLPEGDAEEGGEKTSSSGDGKLHPASSCGTFREEATCIAHHEQSVPCHWCCGNLCHQGSADKCASLEKLLLYSSASEEMTGRSRDDEAEANPGGGGPGTITGSSWGATLRSKNGLEYDTCSATGAHALVLTSIQSIPRTSDINIPMT
eukprot:g5470.t1